MLTISQLAGFAGVTVRAVRHYHARGLLAEPDRDASGYRRYDAQAVVDLIRIRTLADAGVPLARIRTLLAADPDEFAAAVEEIDTTLRATIRRTQEHRRRIARLAAGDSLVLPDFVVDYLQLLREHGISERTVRIERDGWTLLAVRFPDRIAGWIRLKTESLQRPDYVQMYLAHDRSLDWDPDDPRLDELADTLIAYVSDPGEQDDPDFPRDDEFDEITVALLDAQTSVVSPAWQRLRELLEERGYTGWTEIRPE